ncbi:MAG TPA: MarR family EPS-associated transcriptional regulator [Halieaceae bacterium]|jgi:EPS-associated MarR family transcriptional regulator|uniref:MarR family EPS-associated transcriptional regulator n=1 Tax=Haliea sp. TaxID=1932666 RepID=UPI000C40CB20|nr:MarR family EPS-associated transcriptional regulator [Haliea sp.]HAN67960.1 MarR family EPS-associated transcriptional regulator [Halieaceae bacterium]MAD63933.1 MarR family EPS-associated transcriptional regulator [Haliea sp.]MAY92294.1 MarR family EPS-associated transcriptional regulator [Haliea sp.]MBK42218.1 MarR family EPS-associated transcriptional regulator [Haliea sp.]MBP68327.1 MarR family EPS-associated transcriptional regulator [Haliea sp.]|tara:strand:+ start:324 stop:662 length:339 start_codon:yes stop_codon:yes gene_type:complete
MSDAEQHLKVLRLLQDNPDVTQRQMAQQLGISLGGMNYCLKALVEKGWVKMENFSRNPNKLKYSYLLTPRGVKAKAVLTTRFLQRKLVEYEELKTEIEELRMEVSRPSVGEN